MKSLVLISLFFLFQLPHVGLSQPSDELIIEFQEKIRKDTLFNYYLRDQTTPVGLISLLDDFKKVQKKSGVFAKNRKIANGIVISDVIEISQLYKQLEKQDSILKKMNFPNSNLVELKIGDIWRLSLVSEQQRCNLEFIKEIEGLNTFYENRTHFYSYLQNSLNLHDNLVKSLKSNSLEKLNWDSLSLSYSTKFVPLQTQIYQLESQILNNLLQLQFKLNYYKSKKYVYLKYL